MCGFSKSGSKHNEKLKEHLAIPTWMKAKSLRPPCDADALSVVFALINTEGRGFVAFLGRSCGHVIAGFSASWII